MKNFFLLMFLLFFSTHLLAIPLAEDKEKKLQEIVELFKGESKSVAIKQLKLHESMLLEAINASKDAEAYMLLGRAYFYAAMDAKAKKTLNKALLYNSSLSDAHYFIGLINMYSSKLDDAEKSFRSAIKLNNKSESYFVELGRILEKKDDVKSALIEYKNALKINTMNFSANFYLANIYANLGNNKNAEKHYLAAIKIKPDNISINYNLGQLYQNTNQHKLAIKYFSKIIKSDASEWRAIAKIVQENQALGKKAERDIAVSNIYKLWREGSVSDLQEQGFYIREQKKIDRGNLFVLEYFELKGKRARKFVFDIQDRITGDNLFVVSLGSYYVTTQISKDLGDIGPNDRVYHLDGYAPNGSHYTYAFYNSEPDYDSVRDLVFKILEGKHKALSSTVPSTSNVNKKANK